MHANIVLTSDFPSTPCDAVLAGINAIGSSPRVAWISPSTSTGRSRFPAAQAIFRSLGIEHLEYCDIDTEPNIREVRLSDRYDVVYLTGGDPLVFRHSIRRSGLADRLRAFSATGGIIVGASGGAMQLTANVSLFRLLSGTVDEVVSDHTEFDGLGFVDAEILPHLNKQDAAFLDKVTKYSERIPHDVIAIADGGAVICGAGTDRRVFGEAMRFRGGVRSPIEAAA